MFITGVILTVTMSAHASTSPTPPPTGGPSCVRNLEGDARLRAFADALPLAEASAYTDASMIAFDSPLMQATLRDPKKITAAAALDLRAHGSSLDLRGGRLWLEYDFEPVASWPLTQPLAEVRVFETADLRLELGLVGWITTEYFALRGREVVRIEDPSPQTRLPQNWLSINKWVARVLGIPFDEGRAADRNSAYYSDLHRAFYDRDVRVSSFVPPRLHQDPSEDFARLHELARGPRPASYLRHALGQLAVETVARAREICDRLALEGPILSTTYPNQLLGLAADRVRSSDELLSALARGIDDLGDPTITAKALPKLPEDPFADDGRELMTIHVLGCTPLTFSIPPDPIAGPRGWAVLIGR